MTLINPYIHDHFLESLVVFYINVFISKIIEISKINLKYKTDKYKKWCDNKCIFQQNFL